MQSGNRELILVGDRLLIRPQDNDERTRVGLYLPRSVVENEPVQSGLILETGPGIAIPRMKPEPEEPWQESSGADVRYMPLQAEPGDLALFLKRDAVEIRFEDQPLLVVPHSAILLLIRGGEHEEEPEGK